jgi:selenium metabolism protein YedF
VDNEIAVQNLTKMANQKGYGIQSEKLEEQKYRVLFTVAQSSEAQKNDLSGQSGVEAAKQSEEAVSCQLDKRGQTVVAITSAKMGEGDEALGKVLMKGFIYALSQQDELPATILFYNGGASLTCEESPTLEDLKSLEAQGVEIMTCGTCLNHYGLTEKLAVGSVTNMYVIVEKLMQASKVIRP